MNRVAQCIKMLLILRSRGKASTRELADFLETNPRNIREYRRELEEAGYTIQEIRGRNGGYSLSYGDILALPPISAQEEKVLTEGIDYIASQTGFVNKEKFVSVVSRLVYAASNKTEARKGALSYRASPSKDLSREEKDMLETAQKAIEDGVSIVLNYQGRDKDHPSKVTVDPYKIIYIEESFYLIGWSHTARDYRNYRFSSYRMLSVEPTGKKFLPDSNFRLESYIGSTSAFKGRVFIYQVEVQESHTRLFEEMYWGSDWKKLAAKDGWQSYSFCSDSEHYVFENLFKLGNHVRLRQPEHAVAAYRQKIAEIAGVYQGESV
ncbi:MAG: WYL domain-containing protein [Erysipelotrichaceae bacterium]|nr:WYL domain-containing protein [Erysipelotrichaceae bacterium]